MNNVSIWISLYTVLRSAFQAQLDTAQKKSDLLTKIGKLKIEYEQEADCLSWLANVAHNYNASGAVDLLKKTIAYKEFASKTQGYYDDLIREENTPKIFLIKIEHHIDLLSIRVKKESEILQKIKEDLEPILVLGRKLEKEKCQVKK